MDLNEIDVYIDPDGQVRIEVRGVQGATCLILTAELEAALGGPGAVVSRELTPEAQASLGSELPRTEHIRRTP